MLQNCKTVCTSAPEKLAIFQINLQNSVNGQCLTNRFKSWEHLSTSLLHKHGNVAGSPTQPTRAAGYATIQARQRRKQMIPTLVT